MGPQVFHPYAVLGSLSYLPAQFLTVRADHVLDIGANEVREDGMSQIVVIGADEEEIKLSVQTVLAVVVPDDSVETVIFVFGDGLAHVCLYGVRYIFHQCRMAGREYQTVVKNGEHSPGFFLFSDGVYALSHDP